MRFALSIEKIKSLLENVFDKKVVETLLSEFLAIRKYYLLENWQQTILHAGRFAEVSIACVNSLVRKQKPDLNNIHFGNIFNSLVNSSASNEREELFKKILPYIAKSIYNLRSKKDVAHVKLSNPKFIDAAYCVYASNWILFYLIIYGASLDEKLFLEIIDLMKKEIPLIEEFEDGGIVILDEKLPLTDAILLFLYRKSERVTRRFIFENLRPPPKARQNVDSVIRILKAKRYVDENKDGCIITKKGIIYVEKMYHSKLLSRDSKTRASLLKI